jgi:hypothetical protein
MPHLFIDRNGPLPLEIRAVIFNLLTEAAKRRPLTRQEIRLRCICRPRPWRDAGCDRSTWYRRKKRVRLATEMARAA